MSALTLHAAKNADLSGISAKHTPSTGSKVQETEPIREADLQTSCIAGILQFVRLTVKLCNIDSNGNDTRPPAARLAGFSFSTFFSFFEFIFDKPRKILFSLINQTQFRV